MSKAVKKSGVALVAPQGARSATGGATSAPSAGAEVKRWSAVCLPVNEAHFSSCPETLSTLLDYVL